MERRKVHFKFWPSSFPKWTAGPFGNFNEKIVTEKHPRTVIAQTEEGKILFLVVDGRNPAHSVGLTIPEIAVGRR